MYKNISELLDDPKFEKIVHYLGSNKILSLDDLINFDVEDLYFIPGITLGLVEETQNRINDYLKGKTRIADTEINHNLEKLIQTGKRRACHPTENKKVSIVGTDPQIKEESDKSEVCTNNYVRIPIDVAYVNSKKGAWFVKFCCDRGKVFMDQLSEEDFSELNSQIGIGVKFKLQLEEIFNEYQSSPSSFSERSSEIDLSLFAHRHFSTNTSRWLKSAGIRTIKAMRGFDFDYLLDLGRMNRTIYREITGFLHHLKGQPITKKSREIAKSSKIYSTNDIASENFHIQLRVFTLLYLLSEADYQALEARGLHIVGDLCDRVLDSFELAVVERIVGKIVTPVLEQYLHAFESLPDNHRSILISRATGDTLQEIGDRIGLSRERIRQISNKATKRLINWAVLFGGSLLGEMRRFVSYNELLEAFDEQVHASIISLIYREYTTIQYLDFRDKFDYFPQTISVCEQFEMMARDLIGDGVDFYDQIDVIEDELDVRGLGELDFEDFMHYLISCGYRFYGDFVALDQKASTLIYYDAIDRYFSLDIKLDSKKENEDMNKLRKEVEMKYPGFRQPKDNRSLTAMITRNPRIILSGRGTYRPISKIVYSRPLLNEIREYIQNSTLPSLYYFELFESFKGRLLAETSIDNYHLLHGMLKYLFKESFSFRRDRIAKLGEKHLTVDDRIVQLILNLGRPITKTEIRRTIPGISDFVIAFAIERVPDLIQWDNNRFNHVDNVRLDDYAQKVFSECLKSLTSDSGYTSAQLFYKKTYDLYPQVIENNNLENSDNLFYVASYYLDKEFRFNRKHIASLDFPVEELTVANIVRHFLGDKDSFSYEELLELARGYGWSTASLYNTISSLKSYYVRVAEDEYIKRDLLCISQSDQIAIKTLLENLTRPSGYFALFSIFDYRMFLI